MSTTRSIPQVLQTESTHNDTWNMETQRYRDKEKQKTTFCWPGVCPSYSDQSRTLQRELLTVLSIVRGGVGVKEFRQP